MSADKGRDSAADEEDTARRQQINPGSAFELLGNETRVAVLDVLCGDGNDTDRLLTFSELHDAIGTGSSAGFAYHLEKLVGHYVEKTADGYRLTYAGRQVARAVVAGTYTERISIDGIEIDDPCPVCGDSTLTAQCTDNVLAVECACLDRPIAVLSLPPGSYRRTVGEGLLQTADRHHRYQVALMADGICPECAGPIDATLSRVPAPDPSDDEPTNPESEPMEHESTDGTRAHLEFNCADCGHRLRSPVAFAVVEHPAVIGFFESYGVDVRERPLWNLGEEWSETTLSTEPWCVRVSVRLAEERLDVLVGEGLTIHILDESRTVSNSS